MNRKKLLNEWLLEEESAHVHGWDFSHLNGRCEEDDLPWNYETIIRKYLAPEMKVLDLDTGGGEFLLSLGHPYKNLYATEAYPPNVELCKKTLLPLDIHFEEANASESLPFADAAFDMVIDRHGDLNEKEIHRVLKPDGMFITQQVGAENDRELVELLFCNPPPMPFPDQYAAKAKERFEKAGFTTIRADEAYRPIRFRDVGALVWFARIIEWEFPGFDVRSCLPNLYHAQEILEQNGTIDGKIHRFLLVSRKGK